MNAGKQRGMAVVCGVALATGIQLAGPPSAVASPVSDWGSQADGPASEVRSAMTRLYEEMNSFNLNGAKAACRRLQAAAHSLQSMLPSPSPALTGEIAMGVDDLLSGSKSCLAVGSDPNKGQIASVRRVFETATRHLSNAQSIIDAG